VRRAAGRALTQPGPPVGTMARMSTVAAIDCGTNSIKVLIGTVRDDGRLDTVLRDSRVVRLGQGVDRTGELADEALTRTFAALDEFAETIRRHGVPPARVRFCATSATRDASNAAVFREGVRRRLGIEPEVLSGDEEAALVYAGAIAAQVPRPPEPVLVVDIGGGSTELVLGEGDQRQAVSMDIGSVRLHERHLHTDPPTAAEVAACVADVDAQLDGSLDAAGIPLERTRTVIGTSGTIKTLACGVLALDSYDREAFDHAVLPNAATASFVDALVAMTVAERRALPYMHPGRADVIAAGALIWSRILARVPVSEHVVSEADILHGMAAAIGR
jgi:exopolyphosphatase/guanosine-5'-triphosphate,3'-diphosphate pyrophosphatase